MGWGGSNIQQSNEWQQQQRQHRWELRMRMQYKDKVKRTTTKSRELPWSWGHGGVHTSTTDNSAGYGMVGNDSTMACTTAAHNVLQWQQQMTNSNDNIQTMQPSTLHMQLKATTRISDWKNEEFDDQYNNQLQLCSLLPWQSRGRQQSVEDNNKRITTKSRGLQQSWGHAVIAHDDNVSFIMK